MFRAPFNRIVRVRAVLTGRSATDERSELLIDQKLEGTWLLEVDLPVGEFLSFDGLFRSVVEFDLILCGGIDRGIA